MKTVLATRSITAGITRHKRCEICGENCRNTDALAVVEIGGLDERIRAVFCDHHDHEDIHLMYPEIREDEHDDGFEAMRDAERSREDFAAYQAAGCSHLYLDDRNAGYAH